jgi:hypothetical protein
LPLHEVLYFKAEQKYVTVRTATRSFIMDGALSDLESRYGERFLRIHRNALVARRALRALEKHHDPDEGEGWAVRLQGSTEAAVGLAPAGGCSARGACASPTKPDTVARTLPATGRLSMPLRLPRA